MTATRDDGYDIRSILNQMRQDYWEALAEEEAQTQQTLECLVFSLGGERYAFQTQFAREVIRIPRLVRVPAVQSLIAGIFNLRGEITAAMDIRPLLGLPQPEIGASGRIVVVKSEAFATGIMVEAAHGVRGLALERFEPASSTGPGERQPFTRGHFSEEDGAVVLLDMEELLAAPEIVAGEP